MMNSVRTYWRRSSTDFKSVFAVMVPMLAFAWAGFIFSMEEPVSLIAVALTTIFALCAVALTNYEEAPTTPTMLALMAPMVLTVLAFGNFFFMTSGPDYIEEQKVLYNETAKKQGIDPPPYEEYRDKAQDAVFMELDGVVVVRHDDKFEFFEKVEK